MGLPMLPCCPRVPVAAGPPPEISPGAWPQGTEMGRLEQCCQSRSPRPKGRGFVKISTSQGVAPAELSRMFTFEIGFSDSRDGATSALSVSQRHLRSPRARANPRRILRPTKHWLCRDIREF